MIKFKDDKKEKPHSVDASVSKDGASADGHFSFHLEGYGATEEKAKANLMKSYEMLIADLHKELELPEQMENKENILPMPKAELDVLIRKAEIADLYNMIGNAENARNQALARINQLSAEIADLTK